MFGRRSKSLEELESELRHLQDERMYRRAIRTKPKAQTYGLESLFRSKEEESTSPYVQFLKDWEGAVDSGEDDEAVFKKYVWKLRQRGYPEKEARKKLDSRLRQYLSREEI